MMGFASVPLGFLPYRTHSKDPSHGTPPGQGSFPKRNPFRNWNSTETGSLPKQGPSRNGNPPETGILPKRESSRNGNLFRTGILPERDHFSKWESYRNGIPPKTESLPKQNSSRNGTCPYLHNTFLMFIILINLLIYRKNAQIFKTTSQKNFNTVHTLINFLYCFHK